MQKYRVKIMHCGAPVVFHITAQNEQSAERIARRRYPNSRILGTCSAYTPRIPEVANTVD